MEDIVSYLHPTATPSHAPAHNREYVHTASDGTQRIVFVNDSTGDRWYLLESGRYTHAGFLPSTAAGRYAYDMYRAQALESPRRAYRRLHDDYLLPTPAVHATRAWAPRVPGPRAVARALRAELRELRAETYGAATPARYCTETYSSHRAGTCACASGLSR